MKKENTFAIGMLLAGASMFGFSARELVSDTRAEKAQATILTRLNDDIVQHGKMLTHMNGNLHEVEILQDQHVRMFVDATGDYLSLSDTQEYVVMQHDSLKEEFNKNAAELMRLNKRSYAEIGGLVTGFGVALMGGILIQRPRKKHRKMPI